MGRSPRISLRFILPPHRRVFCPWGPRAARWMGHPAEGRKSKAGLTNEFDAALRDARHVRGCVPRVSPWAILDSSRREGETAMRRREARFGVSAPMKNARMTVVISHPCARNCKK